jgi:hypothetical protein
MNNNDKNPKDSETILMALDQISQTIDVMTSVVGRLRTYVQEHDGAAPGTDSQPNLRAEMRSDRVLH